jgi:GT2 family glycosyltransferase
LNSDTEVISREWLLAMLEHAQRREVGAVGAKLLYPDGSIQHCGVILGMGSVAGHAFSRSPDRPGYFGRVDTVNNYSAVTAACMMVRKEVFIETGGFDEKLAIDYNDIDFCLRLRDKGFLIVYTPYARLYHLESYIRGYADTPEKRMRRSKEMDYFTAKWGPTIEKGDPYYNPNLSLTRLDFGLEAKSRRMQ